MEFAVYRERLQFSSGHSTTHRATGPRIDSNYFGLLPDERREIVLSGEPPFPAWT